MKIVKSGAFPAGNMLNLEVAQGSLADVREEAEKRAKK
jgi:hypothetical protein